ncbi:MAG: spermidine synthase [Verrucomicrobiota bacterium]
MNPKPRFEELDYRQTPLGELILRRRTLLALDHREVYEIILGDAFLMTSLFTEVETALARLGLTAAAESLGSAAQLDVVVGGLGLGYTARAALDHPSTHSLIVVDFLEPVIEWHQRGLVPLGAALSADPRCRFVHGDFFQLAVAAAGQPGFDPADATRQFHAILLDIDHSPSNLLHARHAAFYQPDGLRQVAAKLHPGGVFALWSDDPPNADFLDSLHQAFATSSAHVVTFHNPHQDREAASTVYVATTAPRS